MSSPSSPRPSSPEAARKSLILVVDDVPETAIVLQHTLETAGYPLLLARSGEEALNLLNRVVPRLVLLDIQMPGLDGYEVCRRIRARSDLKRMPIAFVTTRKTREAVYEGLAAGGNDFLVKPFNPSTLVERVRFWTRRSAS